MENITQLSKLNLSLSHVQVYFRHGARTPMHYIKSRFGDTLWTTETTADLPEAIIPFTHVDIVDRTLVDDDTLDLQYRNTTLPGGEYIGMLTTIGQRDLLNLGNRLRRDYVGPDKLLSSPPSLSDIEVRSTRVGRNMKSACLLVTALTGGNVDDPIEISTMKLEDEFLFPNVESCSWLSGVYTLGIEALKNLQDLQSLKDKIRKALEVEYLVDEFDDAEDKYTRDCQVYYVRDDFYARKYNKFPIPPALDALEADIDYYSALELLYELLGPKKSWTSSLEMTVGPVIHLILSKLHQHASMPRLQLIAVHDSTLLPILVSLKICDEVWPPFAADIIFELYSQADGPKVSGVLGATGPMDLNFNGTVDSKIEWTTDMLDGFWIRVLYLGKPLPLARVWNLPEGVLELTGSDDFVPLLYLVQELTPYALSVPDYRLKCDQIRNTFESTHTTKGPRNIY